MSEEKGVKKRSFWERLFDDIWLWVFINVVVFFMAYLLWGWTHVWSIPSAG